MSDDNQPSADDIAQWHKTHYEGQRKAAEERMREMDDALYADASEINRLFTDLTPDQIKTVMKVAEACVNAIGYAGMVKGMAVNTFMSRGLAANGDSFDVLFKQDEPTPVLEKETNDDEPIEPIDNSDPANWAEASAYMDAIKVYDRARYEQYKVWGVYPADFRTKDEFGRDMNDPVTGKMKGYVYCTGPDCGWISESLEVRMEKEPGVDGCKQCQHMAQWGHK